MRRNIQKLTALLLSALLLSVVLSGCGSASAGSGESQNTGVDAGGQSASSGDVRVLEIRYDIEAPPMSYTDENGYSTGLDVEILRLVDEALPEYEFHFEGTSKDDVLSGMTAGVYDIGLHNAFYTEDRAEKFYISTENQGGALAGFMVKKELGDELLATGKTGDALLEEFYDRGLRLAPMIAGDGRTYQIEQYNERHPDKALEFEYTSDMSISNMYYQWIDEGRYDVGMTMKGTWDKNVVPEDGGNHEYFDTFDFVTFKAIKTYPMISKITLDEEFLEKYTAALKEIKASGKAGELAVQFYGEDIYEAYPFEEGW